MTYLLHLRSLSMFEMQLVYGLQIMQRNAVKLGNPFTNSKSVCCRFYSLFVINQPSHLCFFICTQSRYSTRNHAWHCRFRQFVGGRHLRAITNSKCCVVIFPYARRFDSLPTAPFLYQHNTTFRCFWSCYLVLL